MIIYHQIKKQKLMEHIIVRYKTFITNKMGGRVNELKVRVSPRKSFAENII